MVVCVGKHHITLCHINVAMRVTNVTFPTLYQVRNGKRVNIIGMEKIKGLKALKDIRLRIFIESDVQSKKVVKDLKIIEKELKAIDSIITKGVVLVIPESEYLNNERISIQIYKKHFTNEQWQKLLEVLDGQD